MWSSDELPTDYPDTAKRVTESSATFDAKGKYVFVWNLGNGNIAMLPTRLDLVVRPEDYKFVGLVTVRVESKGNPVAAANVSLKTSGRTQSQLLDPSGQGQVRFFAVEPGTLDLKVSYRSEGKSMTPVEQAVKVALKREKTEPVFTVAISEPVEVVSEAKARDKETATPAEAKPGNPIGRIVAVIAVLALAVGVVYFLLLQARQNKDALEAKLKDLGVAIPDAGDPAPATAPATPIAPAPPEKIILDQTSAVPVSAVASIPRLVSDFGGRFELAEGSSLVGRENAPILIEGESTISRRHAEVTRNGDQVTVKDLSSTNGTFVNGAKVDGEHVLNPGDVVQFGAARFRFER